MNTEFLSTSKYDTFINIVDNAKEKFIIDGAMECNLILAMPYFMSFVTGNFSEVCGIEIYKYHPYPEIVMYDKMNPLRKVIKLYYEQ